MKLTIGMATYDDYEGCYFTIQALRMYQNLTDTEIIVIDNHPEYTSSKTLKGQIENQMAHQVRYIESPETVGTSAPRNKVFQEARGDIVLCMDSHVMLFPFAIRKLREWFDANPSSRDLIAGPLIMDDLRTHQTIFLDVWRTQMWGVWGESWQTPEGFHFSTHIRTEKDGDEERNWVDYYPLSMGGPLPKEMLYEHQLPVLRWEGHQNKLHELGYRRLGHNPDDTFEIPGQGLGLFACRKEAWLGFNPLFRGFGGEELYIHEKFRKAGHRCLCLGFLKWLHRFHRPGGNRYPLTIWNKVRNYVIGHMELGLPLDRVYEHFVTGKLMSEKEYLQIVEHPEDTRPSPVPTNPQGQALTLDIIFEGTKNTKENYFKDHMEKIKEVSSGKVVEEISRFHETTVAILAGRPQILRSHLFGGNRYMSLFDQLATIRENVTWTIERNVVVKVFDIQSCDVLVYKTDHCEHDLIKHLDEYHKHVKQFIVLHDTVRNGDLLDDQTPGYQPAMRAFCEEHPEWFVYYHSKESCGLTILGCREEDKPKEPIFVWYPGKGPGTELFKLLKQLGVSSSDRCDCRKKANYMDMWGAEECKMRRDEIIQWLQDNYEKFGWKEKIANVATASIKSILTGLVLKISPLDPFPDLVDESIRRAEDKEKVKPPISSGKENGKEKAGDA